MTENPRSGSTFILSLGIKLPTRSTRSPPSPGVGWRVEERQGSEHPVKLEKYGNVTIIIKGYSLLKAEEAPSAFSCSVRPEGLTALAERRHRVRWKAPPAGTRCQFAGCPPGAADDRKRSLRGPVAKQQGR